MDIFCFIEGETKNNILKLTKESNCEILGKIPALCTLKRLEKSHPTKYSHRRFGNFGDEPDGIWDLNPQSYRKAEEHLPSQFSTLTPRKGTSLLLLCCEFLQAAKV